MAIASTTTVAGAAGCLEVAGDRITAGDLAKVVSAFQAAPANTEVGYTPMVGLTRVLRTQDIRRLADRLGISIEPPVTVCVVRSARMLEESDILKAMQTSLGTTGARIEIVDYSRQRVPFGEIVFPRQNLRAPPPARKGVAMWRGHVSDPTSKRSPVWARVRIEADMTRVVSTQPIASGQVLEEQHLREERYTGFPSGATPIFSTLQAVGRQTRRAVPPGVELRPEMLAPVLEVRRGEMVEVAVEEGAARISLTARAEASGERGHVITLRNLRSGKLFSAVVLGKGKAAVGAQPGIGDQR